VHSGKGHKMKLEHVYYLPDLDELRVYEPMCDTCPHDMMRVLSFYGDAPCWYDAYYIGEV
jgi:hypothetical protein